MKKIAAMWPQEARTKDVRMVALVFAGIICMMTVAQLFSFEKFIPLLDGFGLDCRFIAVTLVVCGVFSMPFLLQMKLSIAMRWASMMAGWVVVLLWLFLGVWMNVGGVALDNAGLLGASVELIPGWWVVVAMAGLGVLAVWSAWGLWPGARRALEPGRKK
jgi:hypothetical protein